MEESALRKMWIHGKLIKLRSFRCRYLWARSVCGTSTREGINIIIFSFFTFFFAYCHFYEEKKVYNRIHSRRKESTLNFWLWRGHGFEKYNIKKRFSFHRFFSSPTRVWVAMYFTYFVIVSILTAWLYFFLRLLAAACLFAWWCLYGVAYTWREELLVSVIILFGFHLTLRLLTAASAISSSSSPSLPSSSSSFLRRRRRRCCHFYDQGNFMWSSRPLILKSSNCSRENVSERESCKVKVIKVLNAAPFVKVLRSLKSIMFG